MMDHSCYGASGQRRFLMPLYRLQKATPTARRDYRASEFNRLGACVW